MYMYIFSKSYLDPALAKCLKVFQKCQWSILFYKNMHFVSHMYVVCVCVFCVALQAFSIFKKSTRKCFELTKQLYEIYNYRITHTSIRWFISPMFIIFSFDSVIKKQRWCRCWWWTKKKLECWITNYLIGFCLLISSISLVWNKFEIIILVSRV